MSASDFLVTKIHAAIKAYAFLTGRPPKVYHPVKALLFVSASQINQDDTGDPSKARKIPRAPKVIQILFHHLISQSKI